MTAPETTPGEGERGSSGGGAAGKLEEAEEDTERERDYLKRRRIFVNGGRNELNGSDFILKNFYF